MSEKEPLITNEVLIGRDGEKQFVIGVPSVPNFIRCDGVMRDLTYFTDAQLEKISSVWKTNLYQNRIRQRQNK